LSYIPNERDNKDLDPKRHWFGIIEEIVELTLSEHMEPNPGLKSMRLEQPKKYDGRDSIDHFITWLQSVCTHLQLHGFGGNDNDLVRSKLLASMLEGTALKWYQQEYKMRSRTFGRQQSPWLFVEIACDLFERFVHSATLNVAWECYQSVTYKASEGVAAFYNELMDASAELVHQLSESELVRRFQEHLPESMWNHLVMHNSVTVEFTPLRKVLDYVLRYERSRREMKVKPSSNRQQADGTRPKDSSTGQTAVVHTTVDITAAHPKSIQLVRRGDSQGRDRSATRENSRNRSGPFRS
jgi:hypothetical protein